MASTYNVTQTFYYVCGMNSLNSIFRLLERFPDETACIQYLERVRWTDGNIISPYCAESKVYRTNKPGRYKCSASNKYFTVRTGTIFQDSNIKLKVWFVGLYIMTYHKKGISSHQLGKDLGITQKSAWFMLHRFRFAMGKQDTDAILMGIIEMDETYIGGKEKNKHASAKLNAFELAEIDFQRRQSSKDKSFTGRSMDGGKSVVFGMVERKGKVKTVHVPNAQKHSIMPLIESNIEKQARVYTDEFSIYDRLKRIGYKHDTIKHKARVYVQGDIHTNTIENYWSVLKRGIYGTYHQVSKEHLQAYLNEFSYRYNHRQMPQNERFCLTLMHKGKLPYKVLVSGHERQTERYIRKEYRKGKSTGQNPA